MSTGSSADGSGCSFLTDWRFASSAPPKRTVSSYCSYFLGAGAGVAGVVVVVGAVAVGAGVSVPDDDGDEPPVSDPVLPVSATFTTVLSSVELGSLPCFAMPNGFLALPSTLRRRVVPGSACATIGCVANSPSALALVVGTGEAGSGGAGSLASANGTAARAATSRIATGQRRRWTNWRRRLVTALLIGLQ